MQRYFTYDVLIRVMKIGREINSIYSSMYIGIVAKAPPIRNAIHMHECSSGIVKGYSSQEFLNS